MYHQYVPPRCTTSKSDGLRNGRFSQFCWDGRGDWIRTSDIVLPKHALYQAELLPESRIPREYQRI